MRILEDKVMPLWCRVVWLCVEDVAASEEGSKTLQGGIKGDYAVGNAVRSAEEFLRSGLCYEICGMDGEEIIGAARRLGSERLAARRRRASSRGLSDEEFLKVYDGEGCEAAARMCGLTPSGAKSRAAEARKRLRLRGCRAGFAYPGDAELLAADTREKRMAIADRCGKSDKWVQRMRRDAMARQKGWPMVACAECGGKFERRAWAQKYCSRECREQAQRLKGERPEERWPSREFSCACCGKRVVTIPGKHDKRTRFCSEACSSKYRRQKRRRSEKGDGG